MLHPALDDAFDDLLLAWRHHEERRSSGAAIAALAASREALDHARSRVAGLRRALNPEEHEAGEAAMAATCPSLGSTVVLYSADRIGDDAFRCVCGEVMPAAAAVPLKQL